MTDDPFASLAVGLTADKDAAKAKRGRPPKNKPDAAPQPEAENQPAPEPEAATETAQVEAEPADTLASADPVPDAPGNDAESVFNRKCERLVRIAEEAEFESGTALGDLIDLNLDLFKSRPKLWSAMSQDEQQTTVRTIKAASQKVLGKVVQVVAEEDSVSVHGELAGKFTVAGDTIKVEFAVKNADMETLMQMHKMSGHRVVIISADDKRFSSARREPTIDPDQPVLGFATGGTLSPDPEPEKPAAPTPPADDSDLAGEAEAEVQPEPEPAAEPQPDAPEPVAETAHTFEDGDLPPPDKWGVYDDEEDVWLSADSETWGPLAEAGKWPASHAKIMAGGLKAQAIVIPA